MAETITGISDNQLETLVAGGWVDDSNWAPGWERRALVEETDGPGQTTGAQQVTPGIKGWEAHSDTPRYGGAARGWFNSLEEALSWCNDRAEGHEIESPTGSATRQETRFARQADSN